MSIGKWVFKTINSNRIFSFFETEIKLKDTKNLTNKIIDFCEGNEFSKNMPLGIDVSTPDKLHILSKEQFRQARKDHFQNLPEKPFIKWELGINNFSNTILTSVFPNVNILNKKSLILSIGALKENGFSTFTLNFERIAWFETYCLIKFLSELKDFLENS